MTSTALPDRPQRPVAPSLPKPGNYITLYQMTGIVEYVEPQSDYCWRITVAWNMDGGVAYSDIFLPTDTLTY